MAASSRVELLWCKFYSDISLGSNLLLLVSITSELE